MVKGVIKYLTRNEYAPASYKKVEGLKPDADIGALAVDFEAFHPNPAYATKGMPTIGVQYPLVQPKGPSIIPPIAPSLRAIIDTMWKRAEPTAGAARGPVSIGARGPSAPAPSRQTYQPHVVVIPKTKATETFADDWGHMDNIQRTDAFTMRGDTRNPATLIGKDGGFFPANTRKDDYYIYGPIYDMFKDYMQRRFGQVITQQDYIRALNAITPTGTAKALLVDYLMWRKVAEGEAFHLGRMVKEEALKGYMSTSRSFVSAAYFGTGRATRHGWCYVTRIRGGFVVPTADAKWGTHEQEIAQWGPIVAADILGFRRIRPTGIEAGVIQNAGGYGPIYMRRRFRKDEPQAFAQIFNFLSHQQPGKA